MNKMVYQSENPIADWFISMKEVMKNVDLSEIHDSEKCHGKMVSISVDLVGIERCGYCNKIVDYKGFLKSKLKHEMERNIKQVV